MKATNTPMIQSWLLQTDGRKTTSTDQALTTDTSATHKTVCTVSMPTIKLSSLPICSHNIKSSMEVIPTISMKGFGSKWRTT